MSLNPFSPVINQHRAMIVGPVTILIAYLTTEFVYGENVRVCSICKCPGGKMVDCSRMELSSSFEASAWSDISGPNATTYTEINLSNNRIGHVKAFPELNITKLNLRQNSIVKIDDLAFRNLTRLIELDLGENQITTNNLLPKIFQGPFSREYYEPLPIQRLDLSGNELHSLHSLVFEHLPHIRRLNLEKNPFKMLDKSTVVALSSLQEIEILNLSGTELEELPVGFLHSLKTLRELILKGNFLKEVPSNVLYESHNLVALNLDNNLIRVVSTERPFPEMPSLRILHMSNLPKLNRIEKFSMRGLGALETFQCTGNDQLEFISPLAFASSENDTTRPNVTSLSLNDNALRYLDKSFLRIENLKYVNLLGNIWSCDCQNQWMISELIPLLIKTHSHINGLICSEPDAMKGKHFLTLYKTNYSMRCLDYYGNDPENDSVILITVFSLIIAAMAVGLIIIWKIKLENYRRGKQSDYSRAFYRPARSDDRY